MSPPNVDSTMNLVRARSTLIASVCLLAGSPALSQTVRVLADSGWVSQRIVMLKGMGEVHSPSHSTRLATAVGINLVAPISRREGRSEEHTSELQSHSDLVCRLLLEKKKKYGATHMPRVPITSPTCRRRVES